ncbi:MAG: cell division protein FtsX [Alphaproteobacteria bacterium]
MRTTLPLLPRHGPGRQRFLLWIIALMAYLAALTMIGVFMIDNTISAWQSTVGGVATAVVPTTATDGPDGQTVIGRLLAVDGIAAARAVPDWELNALLAPWLTNAAQADLPLPQVYEIVLGRADPDAIRATLRSIAPAAELTTHDTPIAGLVQMGHSIRAVGTLIVLLVLAAATGTVVFTTRASLVIHQHVIDLVHMMGATDHRLARPFRERALQMGLIGGLVGIAGAMMTLVLVVALIDADVIGLSRAAMTGWQWLAVAAIAPVFAAIPMATAHLTVLRALSRLP